MCLVRVVVVVGNVVIVTDIGTYLVSIFVTIVVDIVFFHIVFLLYCFYCTIALGC